MKLITRLFVLSLVVTGAFASTRIANAATPAIGARGSALPIPMCDPSDPNGCGMAGDGNPLGH